MHILDKLILYPLSINITVQSVVALKLCLRVYHINIINIILFLLHFILSRPTLHSILLLLLNVIECLVLLVLVKICLSIHLNRYLMIVNTPEISILRNIKIIGFILTIWKNNGCKKNKAKINL